MNSMVIFHRYVKLPEGIFESENHLQNRFPEGNPPHKWRSKPLESEIPIPYRWLYIPLHPRKNININIYIYIYIYIYCPIKYPKKFLESFGWICPNLYPLQKITAPSPLWACLPHELVALLTTADSHNESLWKWWNSRGKIGGWWNTCDIL